MRATLKRSIGKSAKEQHQAILRSRFQERDQQADTRGGSMTALGFTTQEEMKAEAGNIEAEKKEERDQSSTPRESQQRRELLK